MPYFKEIFDYARTLDPQHRPLTYTNLLMAAGGKDKCHQFADVICLNRYYGWYVQDGYQLIGAKKAFINEMNQWMNTEPNKPFLFTEYGADTDCLCSISCCGFSHDDFSGLGRACRPRNGLNWMVLVSPPERTGKDYDQHAPSTVYPSFAAERGIRRVDRAENTCQRADGA